MPAGKRPTAPKLHTIGQVLNAVSKAKKNEDKFQILLENDSEPLRMYLRMNFDPSIVWALPEKAPPFHPNPVMPGMSGTHLRTGQVVNGLYRFLPSFNIIPSRREALFIQLLESLDTEEASLLLEIKEKTWKGCSENVVLQAFPEIDWRKSSPVAESKSQARRFSENPNKIVILPQEVPQRVAVNPAAGEFEPPQFAAKTELGANNFVPEGYEFDPNDGAPFVAKPRGVRVGVDRIEAPAIVRNAKKSAGKKLVTEKKTTKKATGKKTTTAKKSGGKKATTTKKAAPKKAAAPKKQAAKKATPVATKKVATKAKPKKVAAVQPVVGE